MVIATNGGEVSPAPASLPQGGMVAPVYYSAARKDGIIAANTLVTGGQKSAASGVFAYIDNIVVHHHDPMMAFRGLRNYEDYLREKGSKFNVCVIPLRYCH